MSPSNVTGFVIYSPVGKQFYCDRPDVWRAIGLFARIYQSENAAKQQLRAVHEQAKYVGDRHGAAVYRGARVYELTVSVGQEVA